MNYQERKLKNQREYEDRYGWNARGVAQVIKNDNARRTDLMKWFQEVYFKREENKI